MTPEQRSEIGPLPYSFLTRLLDRRQGRLDGRKGIPALTAATPDPRPPSERTIVPSPFLLGLRALAAEREQAVWRQCARELEELERSLHEARTHGQELSWRLEHARHRLQVVLDKWAETGVDYCRTNEEKLNATLVRRRRIAERERELAPLDQQVTDHKTACEAASAQADHLARRPEQIRADAEREVLRWRAHYDRRALAYLAVVCRRRPEITEFVPRLWPPSPEEEGR